MADEKAVRLDPLQNIINVKWKSYSWLVAAQCGSGFTWTVPDAAGLPGACDVSLTAIPLSSKSSHSENSFGPAYTFFVDDQPFGSGSSASKNLQDAYGGDLPTIVINVTCIPGSLPDAGTEFVDTIGWNTQILIAGSGFDAKVISLGGGFGLPAHETGDGAHPITLTASITLTPTDHSSDQNVKGWNISISTNGHV